MRQIKVELEKDWTKCPRKEHNYWMVKRKNGRMNLRKVRNVMHGRREMLI